MDVPGSGGGGKLTDIAVVNTRSDDAAAEIGINAQVMIIAARPTKQRIEP